MPPVENNTPAPEQSAVPTPQPAPQPAKKPGFFARLFGGKKEVPVVPVNHESQTPTPQLSDSSAQQNVASVTPEVATTVPAEAVPVEPTVMQAPVEPQPVPMSENSFGAPAVSEVSASTSIQPSVESIPAADVQATPQVEGQTQVSETPSSTPSQQ